AQFAGRRRSGVGSARGGNGGGGRRDAPAARGKEALQQLGGTRLADAAINFRRVMAGRLGEETRTVLYSPAFRIGRAEIEPADPGKGDGGGAHGARLERDVEGAIGQPFAAEPRAG